LVTDVASVLKDEEVSIRVEGHADRSGDETDNWTLSSKRSVAVVMALRTKGPIEGERLEATALGAFHPGPSIGEDPDWSRRIELILRADDVGAASAAERLEQWRIDGGP
jgi:outer membrane protein OmpA-like peptidoglycan-associated protein